MPLFLILPLQLISLKLRLFVNGFRRERGTVLLAVVASIVAVVIVGMIVAAAPALARQDDEFVRKAIIVGGSVLSLAAFLLPFMITRSEVLDPRALRGYGFHAIPVGLWLLLFSLVGPLLLLAPIAWAPVGVWRDDPSVATAAIAAPLLFAQGLLSVRLGEAAGAALANRPRWSTRVRVIGVVLLLGGLLTFLVTVLPRLALLFPSGMRPVTVAVLQLSAFVPVRPIVDVLEWSPLGVLWAAPSHSTFQHPELDQRALWVGAIGVVVLFVLWMIVVAVAFRATRRIPVERRGGVPGWFRRLPSTPAGAIAARSFTYWVRDPRYRAIFGFLPFVPIVALGAMAIGGIPLSVSALVPLPIMVLLLAFSTHNDVAWDSSAVWTHVVAQTRGTDDRVGRLVPVLVFGGILIAIGAPLSAWGHGDWRVLPAILGVCLALLFGGLGVSSGLSSRFPYAASRPGDPAFQQPQVSGGTGGGTQAASFFLTIVVALPAIGALFAWLSDLSYPWNWIALLLGIQAGLVALFIGIRVGGVSFDRRGPELLAFTMRN